MEEKILKAKIKERIEKYFKSAMDLVKKLYDHPEIGGQEFYAHDLLTSFLEKEGYEIDRHMAMETDFLAYGGEKGGSPKILIPAEFDALPEIGHGCGHNLFAGISILAFLALSPLFKELGAEVLLAGTPAEENLGGKIAMKEEGVFDGVDAALMIHPGNENSLGSASSALYPMKFEFFGKSAHACKANEGASALDAAVMSYISINLQRQFLKEGAFIHGIIKDGGKAANVIPDYASLEYYFRAPSLKEAKEMAELAEKKAELNAKASGCQMKSSIYECIYGETILNDKLASIMKEEFINVGRKDVKEPDKKPSGSTDVGAISFLCPTIQATIKIAEPEEANGHSREMAAATISNEGSKALKDGAEIIAASALKLVNQPEVLKECWDEEKAKLA